MSQLGVPERGDREAWERLVDAQQTLLEWASQKSGLTPKQAVVAHLLVANSLTEAIGVSHAELMELMRSLEEIRGRGNKYPLAFPWDITKGRTK